MEITAVSPTIFSICCGLNEAGVAISGNGLPLYNTNPHPERNYSIIYQSLYQIILQNSHNITDAIRIVNSFNFGSGVTFQVHVADANGNAYVVSPDADGEMVITRKSGDYLISTNTNIAEIERGVADTRTEMAKVMLERGQNYSKDTVKNTLQCVRANNYEGILTTQPFLT